MLSLAAMLLAVASQQLAGEMIRNQAARDLSECVRVNLMAPQGATACNADYEATLAAADAADKAATEQAAEQATSQYTPVIEEKTDEFEGITWVQASNNYKIQNDQWTSLSVYYGRFPPKQTVKVLRLKATYHGSEWVFASTLKLIIDEQRYIVVSMNSNTDASGTGVWETIDEAITDPKLIKALCAAKAIKVRFDGRNGNADFSVPANQLSEIKAICAKWDAEPKPIAAKPAKRRR
jgi:hypothetical protein